jgi:uncharacterized membrane protein YhiD involved in acid resistance
MTFNEFIQETGLITNDLPLIYIFTALLLALVLGVFIFWIYKRTFQGILYSKSFNVSLIGLSLITCAIILAVTSNVILALGMVGALSIVRFRNAVKDPMDLVFMFWALAAGIIVGAGLFGLAIITCLFIGIVLSSITKMTIQQQPSLIIVRYSDAAEENAFFELLNRMKGVYKIKSKIKNGEYAEITFEVRSRNDNSYLVNDFNTIEGVQNTAMMSYDGEYAV